MPDLQRVLKGLECCAVKNITPESARHCGICPYDRERNGEMDFDCQNDLLCDALELLKAREPLEPDVDGDTWICSKCGHKLEHQEMLGTNVLFHERYSYCPNCGKAVKWDD